MDAEGLLEFEHEDVFFMVNNWKSQIPKLMVSLAIASPRSSNSL